MAMKRRTEAKRQSSGGGGNSNAWTNEILKVADPKKDIVIDSTGVHFTGTLVSGKNEGQEVTVSARDKRTDAVKGYLQGKEQLKNMAQPNTTVILEGFHAEGDGYRFNFARPFLEPKNVMDFSNINEETGKPTPVSVHNIRTDQYVQLGRGFTRKKEDGTVKYGRNVNIHRPDMAFGVSGPAGNGDENPLSATRAIAAQAVEDLAEVRDELDEETLDILTRAEKFDELNGLEKMAVIWDIYVMSGELTDNASKGFSGTLRAIDMEDDGIEMYGGVLQGGNIQDAEGNWRPRYFAEAVENTLNFYSDADEDRVTFDEILEKGVIDAMEKKATYTDDDEVLYEEKNPRGNNARRIPVGIVDILDHVQNSCMEEDAQNNVLIEIIPVERLDMGNDTAQNSAAEAEPFHPQKEATDNEGNHYTESVISTGHVASRVMTSKDEDGMDVVPPEGERHNIVTKVQVSQSFGVPGKPTRATGWVGRPSMLPTPNSDQIPAVKSHLEKTRQEYAKQFDSRNWGKSNSKDNDGPSNEENEYEAEGRSPGMG
ncbi:hypothetical protein [Salipiger mucosus]|uniref:Uncharacterized protein n=1 Tax=Salipiger mucosus DSM 16094 TaxID=1123237 RepID=S9QV84_9RHOB|nr:hypothetical protein [Salipiger mucosus]EPX83513.1 hypothetical protein Salmuc_02121 [Salipiger mucosus DSM 16094]